MKLTKFLISLPPCIFSVVCILAVLYLTLVPRPLPDMDIPLFPGADKVVHAIMMMGVMLCLAFDYMRKKRNPQEKAPLVILLLFLIATIAFGGAIELLQGLMAMGRGEDVYDFIADAAGAIIGFIITVVAWRRTLIWLQGCN